MRSYKVSVSTEYYSSGVRHDFTSKSEQVIKIGTFEEIKPIFDLLKDSYKDWDINSESKHTYRLYSYITYVKDINDMMIFVSITLEEILKGEENE
jgi:hypothetical protein